MITIKEAKTKKELTEYIKFPFSLYKDNELLGSTIDCMMN